MLSTIQVVDNGTTAATILLANVLSDRAKMLLANGLSDLEVESEHRPELGCQSLTGQLAQSD